MMTMFVLQVAFFIAVAFGLGCLFGCWLKGKLGGSQHHSATAAAVTHEGAARTTTAGELAAERPHYEPATSPQPSPAINAPADAAENTAPVVAEPEVKAKPAAARKPSGTKKGKAPAAKAPASKASTSGKKIAGGTAPRASSKKPTRTEPVSAKAKPQTTAPVAATVPDNLKQIKGIGPTIEAKLNAAGINSFAQIAAWTKKQQAEFAEQLSFAGRIEREEWVSQAKILAKGGSTEFAKRVAKGEVASSAGAKPRRGGKS